MFNLYDFTVTSDGRSQLRDIMAHPLTDIELIKERQKSVESFQRVIAVHGKSFQGEIRKAIKPFRSFAKKFGCIGS